MGGSTKLSGTEVSGTDQRYRAAKPSHKKGPNGLTEGQERFCQLIAANPSGTLTSAYSEAYVISRLESDNISWLANKLYTKPEIKARIEAIQQQCRVRFIDLAPKAIDNIQEMADNCKNEMVRLKANQEILHQSGLIPPTRVEAIHVGVFGQASAEDIRALIRRNLEGDKNEVQS
jgi:hypothetical protein